MRLLNVLFLVLFVNVSCSQIQSKPITEVTADELKNVVLVDVRTPQEFSAGHLDDAQNINLFDKQFTSKISKISKDETIYVYCKVGGRSAQAQKKLQALGYKKVVNLEGGYDAWKSKK